MLAGYKMLLFNSRQTTTMDNNYPIVMLYRIVRSLMTLNDLEGLVKNIPF